MITLLAYGTGTAVPQDPAIEVRIKGFKDISQEKRPI
jgi:hypothetical protein